MALFVLGVSFVISVDTGRLHIVMFMAVLTWVVIGLVYSVRSFIQVSRIQRDRRREADG